ncbi:hemerythrin domain-containing protein [Microlunatus capsulatus]|uniref:Hemerythrin-like domain-containing protein n=1 Tax=Microlunatus capsulatus TaxID=99117 RepID=A0ABS4Z7R3_9ACTN|nr:hemerythrin domain-containing protein [Microlunatus capsulatus]MBP2417082.1 hypothetical protein [Microlunatus capsulatus]
MTSTPEDPRASLGRRLVAVHDELRATLRGLRDSSHPGRDGSLGAHCLTFCAAVSRHHRGEDAELFPQVVAADPALAAAVDQLQHDHNLIGFLLRDLTAAVQALPAEPDDQELLRFRQHLDGLAAILESHFRFEERKVLAVLEGRPFPAAPPAWDVSGGVQDEPHG